MARSSVAKAVAVTVLLGVVSVGAIVVMTMRSYSTSCEVCVTYHGRSMCREAFGATRDEAVRTATDNACAFLASGMSASIECQNTRPDRVTCNAP